MITVEPLTATYGRLNGVTQTISDLFCNQLSARNFITSNVLFYKCYLNLGLMDEATAIELFANGLRSLFCYYSRFYPKIFNLLELNEGQIDFRHLAEFYFNNLDSLF